MLILFYFIRVLHGRVYCFSLGSSAYFNLPTWCIRQTKIFATAMSKRAFLAKSFEVYSTLGSHVLGAYGDRLLQCMHMLQVCEVYDLEFFL